MSNYANLYRDLVQKKVVFCVGSDISKHLPSSIPCYPTFVRKQLQALAARAPEVQPLLEGVDSSYIPWQVIAQVMQDKIGSLYWNSLEAFTQNPPNHFHKFLAQMLAHDSLPVLLSTAIDNCIEQAFSQQQKPLQVLSDLPSHIGNFESPTLIKLNGCAMRSELIRAFDEIHYPMGKLSVACLRYIADNYHVVLLGEESSFSKLLIMLCEICQRAPAISWVTTNPSQKILAAEVAQLYNYKLTLLESSLEQFFVDLSREMKYPWSFSLSSDKIVETEHTFNLENWAGDLGGLYSYIIAGDLARKMHQPDRALKYLKQALKFAQRQMNAHHFSQIFLEMAECYVLTNKYDRTVEYWEKSIDILRKLNRPSGVAQVYLKFGNLYCQHRQWSLSLKHYERALHIARDMADSKITATSYHQIGRLYEQQEKWREAIEYYIKGIEFVPDDAKQYHALGNAYFHHQEFGKAQENYRQSLEVALTNGDLISLARSYANQGCVVYEDGNYLQASQYYRKAKAIFQQLQETSMAFAVYYHLAILENCCHNVSQANIYLDNFCSLLGNEHQDYEKVCSLREELNSAPTAANTGNDCYMVTGCAGFIGFNVCLALLQQQCQVVGIDNFYPYYPPVLKKARYNILQSYKNFQGLKLDLTDIKALKRCFKKYRPTTICHLAAQPGVRYSLVNPFIYQKFNVEGFVNIIELAHLYNIKRLVYASSSSVYGNETDVPYKETLAVDTPISLYAATKKANELLAHTYTHLYGLPTVGLRLFTVYGPWGRPDMALWRFTDAIFCRQPITVYNNGNMHRDFTYIKDIVDGVLAALSNPNLAPYEIINLGNHRPENIMKVVSLIEKNLQQRATIEFAPLQPGDMLTTYACTEKAHSKLDYTPSTTIEQGVAEFVTWFRNNLTVIAKVRKALASNRYCF